MQSSDEKLREALRDCLERELAFVPPAQDIKKLHTPSKQFEKRMQGIIRTEQYKEKWKTILGGKKKFYYAAAVILLFLGVQVGTNFMYMGKSSPYEADMSTQTTEEMATATDEETGMASSMADTAAGEASINAETSNGEAEATDIEVLYSQWSVSQVLDGEVTFSLTNSKAEEGFYSDISLVEKAEEGKWISVYTKEDLEEYSILGMDTVEERIKASDYNMKEAGIYRLYRYINEEEVTVDIEIP
ncbi:hypothetical protein [Konateibacter massiliensis]|uniref:hypothetical protein n=1 Tax=Konateibacter massiliensis TaxID=2002841 RepID=UPI000C14AE17|nr:hypothetical protein [Konateibacter massiliensis]